MIILIMEKENFTKKIAKKTSKKILKKATTTEGIATISGAVGGGFLGSTLGVGGSFAGLAIAGGAISGVLPVAAVGAGVGYLGIKLFKSKRKIKKLEQEVHRIKSPKIEKK